MPNGWNPALKSRLAAESAVLLDAWRAMGSNQELDRRNVKHICAAVTIFTFASQLPPKNRCQTEGTSAKTHFHAATVDMEF
jgi:hypothetical protein